LKIDKEDALVHNEWRRLIMGTVCRPTERGGVAGASAPGPGGPKGARRAPSKKIKLV